MMNQTNTGDEGSAELSSDDMAKLADFDAEISHGAMRALEESVSTRERLHQHKLCLVAVSSTAEMLKNLRRESPDEFDAMFDMVDLFQEHVKGMAELSQKAFYRMLVIGSLTDEELQD